MINLNSIMVGTMQPKVMSDFYEKVFGKKPDMSEDNWSGWQIGSCFFGIGEHSEVSGMSKEPARIMFNLESKEINEEYARIKETGATVVKELYEMGGASIATFSDPDGNYFQLMTPWDENK